VATNNNNAMIPFMVRSLPWSVPYADGRRLADRI
jgi:hypothetical protein